MKLTSFVLGPSITMMLMFPLLGGCTVDASPDVSDDSDVAADGSPQEEAGEGAEDTAASAAQALVVTPGEAIQLVGVQSRKCVGVPSGSTSGPVSIFTCNGSIYQSWIPGAGLSGYGQLKNVGSGKCMQISGTSVIQATCDGGADQKWDIDDLGAGTVSVLAQLGNALEVYNMSTDEGANLARWSWWGGSNQKWRIANALHAQWPCDGNTAPYDTVVSRTNNVWTAKHKGKGTTYTGSSLPDALASAFGSLTTGRTVKESVLVKDSGDFPSNRRVSIPSYTVLNMCGTVHVTGGQGQGDYAPVFARSTTDIDIPHATITGTPSYGMFFREVTDLHIGRVTLDLAGGLGVRIDNANKPGVFMKNTRIDYVYVEGSGDHGVETAGLDGFFLGTLIARNTGNSGLLLNRSIHVDVGLVDAEGAGTGTGYAALRFANENGRIGAGWPTNVYVGKVKAHGGGRGIFCVSESGGFVIDTVDIKNTGGESILLENCHNGTLAAKSGTVVGTKRIYIAAREEDPNMEWSSDLTIKNLHAPNSELLESPCVPANNNKWINNTAPAVKCQ